MRLGLYIFAALTLIIIISVLTYALNPNHYLIEVLGISFNLPISVWIALPMLLLLLFTVMHMFFYGMKNYFKMKKWQRDTETLEDALYWSLVNEPKEQKYAMNEVRSSAALLSKASLSISDNIEGLSPRLGKIVNIILKVKNGEYVDFKEEKIAKIFNAGNPILIQNRLNCLKSDAKFVEDVMKSDSEYSEIVQKEALEIFAAKVSFEEASKYVQKFDVANFMCILNRVNQEDHMGLNKDILTDFVEGLNFACVDFISIAKVTKKYFKPDENLALFHAYQKENTKAQNAYVYLLFEYELIDQAGAYLDEQAEDELMKFRAFYKLKEKDRQYRLEDIIDTDTVCNNTRFS